MPVVVTCMHCAAKMRIPENVVGKKVKCPKCKDVFTAAFEEETVTSAGITTQRPAGDPGFEVVDDGPVSRGRRRPGRDRDDDFDDEPDERERGRVTPQQRSYARIGLLLAFIGACMYVSGFGVLYVVGILVVSGVRPDPDWLALGGLPGLVNWVLVAVGVGLCLAGPRKNGAFGLALAALALAIAHLTLVVIVGFIHDRSAAVLEGPFQVGRAVNWSALVSSLDYVCTLAQHLRRQLGRFDWLTFLAGLCELAFLVVWTLYVRAAALSAKEFSTAGSALALAIGFGVTVGVLILLNLVVSLIFKTPPQTIAGQRMLVISVLSLNFLALIGVGTWYLILLMMARNGLRR